MACWGKRQCVVCNEEKEMDLHDYKSVCSDCKQAKEDKARKEHFDALDKLSINDRLRKVEEWIYDYNPYDNPMTRRYR